MKNSRESFTRVCVDTAPLLKVADVAKRLSSSVSTVYTLIETGKLEHFRCPGVRVSEDQLRRYLIGTIRGGTVEEASVPKRVKLRHIRLA